MIDITNKRNSLRTAKASGKVMCQAETIERIKSDTLPKGNLFDVAKAAGFLAAKNTSNLIPHCHPIPLDGLTIQFDLLSDSQTNAVIIEAEGKSIGKTGLEMEVLTAVSVAALTIYDLLKPIDKELEINSIKLDEKTGGKSDPRLKYKKGMSATVLVVSDSTAAGTRKDKAGKIVKEILEKYEINVVDYQIVPDDPDQIKKWVTQWAKNDTQFIFTAGGTGFGPKDLTVDTIKTIIEKEAPGISEAMRSYGGDRTALAMLSRSIAGTIGNTMVITLPGSSNGSKESMEALVPGLFHVRRMIEGGGH